MIFPITIEYPRWDQWDIFKWAVSGGNRINDSSKNISPNRFRKGRKKALASRKARQKARKGR